MCGSRADDSDDDPVVGCDLSQAARLPPEVGSIVVMADDTIWRQRSCAFLASEGFVVVLDPAGDAAFDVRARTADAGLVDLGLAARSATGVCTAWKSQSSSPIVAVTSVFREATVLRAYEAGADHVARIDITERQLLAHLRSVLRRAPARREQTPAVRAELSPVLVDAERNVVIVMGTKVAVTNQEREFLELLIQRSGRVVTRAEISGSLQSGPASSGAIDSVVRRLREKLEGVDGQRRITVVRGVGFRFDDAPVAGGPAGPRARSGGST